MESCDRYIKLLSARLDGPLADREARELEAHLAQCPACRALGSQLAAIHAAFPDLEEVPAPEGFAQGVMDRIRAEERPRKHVIPLLRRSQVRALAGLAACAVLCAGIYQAGLLNRGGGAVDYETTEIVSGEVDCAQAAEDLQRVQASAEGIEDGLPREKAAPDGYSVSASALTSGQEEMDAAKSTVQVQVSSTESIFSYKVAGQTVSAVLTLPQLPEGWEALLGDGVEFFADEEGRSFCVVTGEQMEALMALAEDQWQDRDLTGAATNRIAGEELCAVVLTGEE